MLVLFILLRLFVKNKKTINHLVSAFIVSHYSVVTIENDFVCNQNVIVFLVELIVINIFINNEAMHLHEEHMHHFL